MQSDAGNLLQTLNASKHNWYGYKQSANNILASAANGAQCVSGCEKYVILMRRIVRWYFHLSFLLRCCFNILCHKLSMILLKQKTVVYVHEMGYNSCIHATYKCIVKVYYTLNCNAYCFSLIQTSYKCT